MSLCIQWLQILQSCNKGNNRETISTEIKHAPKTTYLAWHIYTSQQNLISYKELLILIFV
jgi:hypothetical protein